ncbi:2,4-diaminopentanoate dehydrogenase, partial [Clostridium polynesiense]|uniref:2,4-diaminopentanoate dehydrogenase n=1 Tax=Clostridium polynesiense TaxID=1325933 RepID=UPI00058BC5FB
GVEVAAVIDADPKKSGKSLKEVLDLEGYEKLIITSDFKKTIDETEADIVILAIDSFVDKVYPYIEAILKAKKNCITIAEEMAYPYTVNADLAEKMHKLALENGVTVLGTGVNPGFVLDTLVVVLSAACRKINRIKAVRINDLSPFGHTVMKTQGVGISPEEFYKGLEDGSIVGHIGFKQSIPLVSKALGMEIDEIEEIREPIISKTYRRTEYVEVKPGMVAGCRHIAYGKFKGETIITMEHPQQVNPELENIKTGDFIEILGEPKISMAITPETPGGTGTVALAVNMIPLVISASPGLKTMIDLPLPHGIENSFVKQRDYYKNQEAK